MQGKREIDILLYFSELKVAGNIIRIKKKITFISV